MIGIFALALQMFQFFEPCEQNVINITTLSTSRREGGTTTGSQSVGTHTTTYPQNNPHYMKHRPNNGSNVVVERFSLFPLDRIRGHRPCYPFLKLPDGNYETTDDTEKVVDRIENLKMAPVLELPVIKNITRPEGSRLFTNTTVADGYFVQYVSEIQALIVAVRQSYWDILQGHAEWSSRWYEVHFPDYYACVTKNLILLMSRSMSEFPRKLLLKIRSVKDAFVRSYVMQEPIEIVDPHIIDGLEDLLVNVSMVMRDYRTSVADLLLIQVRRHEEMLRFKCRIPLTDRASVFREETDGVDYLGNESYSPIDYLRI